MKIVHFLRFLIFLLFIILGATLMWQFRLQFSQMSLHGVQWWIASFIQSMLFILVISMLYFLFNVGILCVSESILWCVCKEVSLLSEVDAIKAWQPKDTERRLKRLFLYIREAILCDTGKKLKGFKSQFFLSIKMQYALEQFPIIWQQLAQAPHDDELKKSFGWYEQAIRNFAEHLREKYPDDFTGKNVEDILDGGELIL